MRVGTLCRREREGCVHITSDLHALTIACQLLQGSRPRLGLQNATRRAPRLSICLNLFRYINRISCSRQYWPRTCGYQLCHRLLKEACNLGNILCRDLLYARGTRFLRSEGRDVERAICRLVTGVSGSKLGRKFRSVGFLPAM